MLRRCEYSLVISLAIYLKFTALIQALGKAGTFNFQFQMVIGISGQLNIYYVARGISADTITVFGTSGTLQVQGNSIILLAKINSR